MSAECGFTQIVNFPTREENILDLFFTTQPSCVQYCEQIPGISDHDIVITTVKSIVSYSKQANHTIYLWRLANLEDMSKNMLNFYLEFTNANTIDTLIEELWLKFCDKLLDIMNTHVPSKIKSNSVHRPWINHTLKQIRRHKQQSYNRARSKNLLMYWLLL